MPTVTLCKILAIYTIDGTWYCAFKLTCLGLIGGTFEEYGMAALPYLGLVGCGPTLSGISQGLVKGTFEE